MNPTIKLINKLEKRYSELMNNKNLRGLKDEEYQELDLLTRMLIQYDSFDFNEYNFDLNKRKKSK